MTKIEWTDVTWNPVSGCSPISAGCANCYAERMARRLAGRYGYPDLPNHFDVTIHWDRLNDPYKWVKPRMVFVCSMGDLFHEDVPSKFILEVIQVIKENPSDTFQILTKRADRLSLVKKFPPNCWVGVTVENQKAVYERIPHLYNILAGVRFISAEPLLEKIDLTEEVMTYCPICSTYRYDPDQHGNCPECGAHDFAQRGNRRAITPLDWMICGGETGPGARQMKAEWAWDLLKQCRSAKVPFFFKKAGEVSEDKQYPIIREYPSC